MSADTALTLMFFQLFCWLRFSVPRVRHFQGSTFPNPGVQHTLTVKTLTLNPNRNPTPGNGDPWEWRPLGMLTRYPFAVQSINFVSAPWALHLSVRGKILAALTPQDDLSRKCTFSLRRLMKLNYKHVYSTTEAEIWWNMFLQSLA